jgi:hypothetical protein
MGGERQAREDSVHRRINHRDTSRAIANHQVTIAFVDTKVVRVVAERDLCDFLPIGASVEVHCAVTAGDGDFLLSTKPRDTLRFVQASDPSSDLSGYEVNVVDRIGPKLGYEQMSRVRVEGHVIDTSTHVWQRNDPDQMQRRMRITRIIDLRFG